MCAARRASAWSPRSCAISCELIRSSGQSPQFDIEMLTGAGLLLRNPHYDTFHLATILIPDLPAYSLSTIASRLGISVPSQHRAMADVETTMAVFLGFIDLLHDYDDVTMERLASYARMANSPLSSLFDEIAKRMKDDDAGTLGSSIAEQLLAKGMGPRQGPEVMFLMQRERPRRLEPTGSELTSPRASSRNGANREARSRAHSRDTNIVPSKST